MEPKDRIDLVMADGGLENANSEQQTATDGTLDGITASIGELQLNAIASGNEALTAHEGFQQTSHTPLQMDTTAFPMPAPVTVPNPAFLNPVFDPQQMAGAAYTAFVAEPLLNTQQVIPEHITPTDILRLSEASAQQAQGHTPATSSAANPAVVALTEYFARWHEHRLMMQRLDAVLTSRPFNSGQYAEILLYLCHDSIGDFGHMWELHHYLQRHLLNIERLLHEANVNIAQTIATDPVIRGYRMLYINLRGTIIDILDRLGLRVNEALEYAYELRARAAFNNLDGSNDAHDSKGNSVLDQPENFDEIAEPDKNINSNLPRDTNAVIDANLDPGETGSSDSSSSMRDLQMAPKVPPENDLLDDSHPWGGSVCHFDDSSDTHLRRQAGQMIFSHTMPRNFGRGDRRWRGPEASDSDSEIERLLIHTDDPESVVGNRTVSSPVMRTGGLDAQPTYHGRDSWKSAPHETEQPGSAAGEIRGNVKGKMRLAALTDAEDDGKSDEPGWEIDVPEGQIATQMEEHEVSVSLPPQQQYRPAHAEAYQTNETTKQVKM